MVAAIALFAPSCGGNSETVQSPEVRANNGAVSQVIAEVLAADQAYADAWLRSDWAAASAMIAPDYFGLSPDGSIDQFRLRDVFARAKALGYTRTTPHTKVLASDVVMVSYEQQMKETFDGRDISGRYWYSTIWKRLDGRWKLLVEQEIPLDEPAQPPN